ncbi:MAG: hypothetical protein IJZ76_07500 [Lachnospiraceae bacterium]|nr:hypothetical protein [Lachnospiraceae bacterium]
MAEKRILPFYMTYPTSLTQADENQMMRDLEYFQQLYPLGTKAVQREIRKVIDIMDYEGSLIYDEFPDRFAMQKLTRDIISKIKLQAEEEMTDGEEVKRILAYDNLEEYMFLLVLHEVWRRRHNRRRGYFLF